MEQGPFANETSEVYGQEGLVTVRGGGATRITYYHDIEPKGDEIKTHVEEMEGSGGDVPHMAQNAAKELGRLPSATTQRESTYVGIWNIQVTVRAYWRERWWDYEAEGTEADAGHPTSVFDGQIEGERGRVFSAIVWDTVGDFDMEARAGETGSQFPWDWRMRYTGLEDTIPVIAATKGDRYKILSWDVATPKKEWKMIREWQQRRFTDYPETVPPDTRTLQEVQTPQHYRWFQEREHAVLVHDIDMGGHNVKMDANGVWNREAGMLWHIYFTSSECIDGYNMGTTEDPEIVQPGAQPVMLAWEKIDWSDFKK